MHHPFAVPQAEAHIHNPPTPIPGSHESKPHPRLGQVQPSICCGRPVINCVMNNVTDMTGPTAFTLSHTSEQYPKRLCTLQLFCPSQSCPLSLRCWGPVPCRPVALQPQLSPPSSLHLHTPPPHHTIFSGVVISSTQQEILQSKDITLLRDSWLPECEVWQAACHTTSISTAP